MVARAGGKASLNPGGEVLLHARNNAFGIARSQFQTVPMNIFQWYLMVLCPDENIECVVNFRKQQVDIKFLCNYNSR